MSAAARHRGGVGHPAGSFPVRSILARVALGCALLAAGWLAWSPARAGVLYRCTGEHGETVFSTSRAGYRDCRRLGSYGPAASKPRRAAPAKTSLDGVRGSAATTAREAGTPLASLAWVKGSVATTATALPAAPSPVDAVASRAPVAAAGAESSSIRRTYYYKVVRADGSIYLGDSRPPLGKGDRLSRDFVEYIATCVACNLHSTIDWARVPLHLAEYADVIRAASARYGVDEAFLRAIIHAESAFNPHALSAKGAQGLMQLMPGTAGDMGVADAFDADDNILGGARYLGLLLKTFNGDERLAAAAYNAGPGAVERYHGVPPYAETEVYVQRVGELRKRYGNVLHATLADRGPG